MCVCANACANAVFGAESLFSSKKRCLCRLEETRRIAIGLHEHSNLYCYFFGTFCRFGGRTAGVRLGPWCAPARTLTTTTTTTTITYEYYSEYYGFSSVLATSMARLGWAGLN